MGIILSIEGFLATMTPSQIKKILLRYGIRTSRAMGQHFLIDEKIANRQIQYASLGKEDTVLEIGPGLGVLTSLLLKKAGKVIAIEKDTRLCHFLRDNLRGLELINADALKIDLPRFDKIVSNLPYQISSPITFKLLDSDFQTGILMYQKEFAERLVAEKGMEGYSRLSVKVYYKAKSEILEVVPRKAFYPEPEVDSAIVRIEGRKPPFKVREEAFFFKVVDAIFSHRRKKIWNSLLLNWKDFAESKEEMKVLLQKLPYLEARPEDLSPEEIGILSDSLYETKG